MRRPVRRGPVIEQGLRVSYDPQPTRIPRPVLFLALAGLLPFLATTALCLWAENRMLALWAFTALAVWGACGLSFLGAVHWGLALKSPAPGLRALLVGAAAPLTAWLSLAFGGRWGLLATALGYVLLLAYEQVAARRDEVPAWYARLRLPLTGVAATCLCAASLYGTA